MTKALLLAAAASLALTACAPTQPHVRRAVFLSGPDTHVQHVSSSRDGRDRVVVIRSGDARSSAHARRAHADAMRHAEEARRHAREAVRLAERHRPDPAEIDRIRRDAEAMRFAAIRMGEDARRQGEQARLQGELARRHGEAARAEGERMRAEAERLRAQCERGEIKCTIVESDGSRTITITR